MKTLTGTALAHYRDDSYRIVWLVEIDADEPGGATTTLRYASRAYTLDGDAYLDALLPDGIRCGWTRLRPRGGVAQVSSFSIRLANHESLVDLQDTYVLDNDPVRVYVIFVTGAETAADKVLVASGVIEEGDWDVESWTLRCIDDSDRDFKQIPTQKVNPAQHPYAPLSEYGKVIPWSFGDFSGNPYLDASLRFAATRCLDMYLQAYTPGYFSCREKSLYQWLPSAGLAADVFEVQAIDQVYADHSPATSGSALRVVTQYRVLDALFLIPEPDNDVASYLLAADKPLGLTANTYATISPGQTMHLRCQGGATAGKMEGLYLWVYDASFPTSGAHTMTLYYNGVRVSAVSHPVYSFTSEWLAANMADTWNLSLFTVKITCTDATRPAYIRSLFLSPSYWDDVAPGQRSASDMFYAGEGAYTTASRQNHVIPGTADTLAAGPVDQLAMIMTNRDLYALPESRINTASFAAAHAARAGYAPVHQLMSTVTWEHWNRFCFEMGLHLHLDWQGRWSVVARDHEAAAQHYFGPDSIALRDAQIGAPPDLSIDKTPSRDVINEVVLRYNFDPMSGEYQSMRARTAQYRYSGTCTVDAAAVTLTDSAATFATGDYPAYAGERIYISDHYTVEVVSVTSDTELAVSPLDYDGLDDIASETTYWGGSGISGPMLRSWMRYKTIAPLGGEYDPVANAGGWPSDFIVDDDTADLFLDYVERWFSQRRIVVELGTHLGALAVELGDTCYLRCPALPARRDAVLLGALGASLSSVATSLTCSTTGYLGNEAFRLGDHLAIDGEVVLVAAEPADGVQTLTITRAQCNTVAAAHASGSRVYLLDQRWEVTGLLYDIQRAQIRVELMEMPRASYRVGCALSADATYASSSYEERVARSWVAPPTGLQEQTDQHSDYSHAG